MITDRQNVIAGHRDRRRRQRHLLSQNGLGETSAQDHVNAAVGTLPLTRHHVALDVALSTLGHHIMNIITSNLLAKFEHDYTENAMHYPIFRMHCCPTLYSDVRPSSSCYLLLIPLPIAAAHNASILLFFAVASSILSDRATFMAQVQAISNVHPPVQVERLLHCSCHFQELH